MTQSRALQAHLDAENSHDVDGIVATFAEDAVLVLNGEAFRGRDLIRKVHQRFGFGDDGAFSELAVREVERYVGEKAIVLEEMLSGRHTGRWEGVDATGRRFEIAVCTVYVFTPAGQLSAERVYFDGATLMKQLRGDD